MRKLGWAFAALVALAAIAQADEQWPQRQVNVIVPFTAGGTTDLFGRVLAQHMQAKLGQPFIVENKAGAGSNIGLAAAAKAAPDGYTILIGTTSGFAINPFLYGKLPFDSARDFQPVSLIARVPNILVVHPRLPAKTLPELVAYLKANPDKLSYGSSGVGTSQHLGTELLRMKTDTRMTHVPYRSSNEIMNALVGGHIDLALDNITLAWPQVKAGTVRAIAVSTTERSPTAPDVPTLAETLPGFDASAWHGVFLPAGTPRPIVDKLNAEVKRILDLPEVKAKFFEIGAVPSPMTPEQFASFIGAERQKWEEVVKAAGVKLD